MTQKTPITASFWNYESLDYLRRQNGGVGLFSPGEGVEEWYERLHSDELLDKAVDIGFNMIVTHFFKGFGLKHEEEEIEQLKVLIEKAHKRGVKVLGYVQLYSLFNETFPYESDDLMKMVVRQYDGSPLTWGRMYFRYKPCYNSPEFIAYIKKVIKYGIEIGLDGFHFDNSNQERCYCENCTKGFRKYLADTIENPKDIIGLKGFDYVNIPHVDLSSVFGWPIEEKVESKLRVREIHDTLYKFWTDYNTEVVAKAHDELFGYAKEISGGKAYVLHNPGFPAGGEVFADFGFKPHRTSKHADFAYAENIAFIEIKDGKLISQIPGYKINDRFGVQTFNTSWARDERGFARFPKNYEEIVRVCAESMIYTGLVYANWPVRFLNRNADTNIELPVHRDSLKVACTYYKENFDLYSDTKSVSNVKVLYDPLNLVSSIDTGLQGLIDTINTLSQNGVAFSIVTEKEFITLNEGNALIIPGAMYEKAEMYDKLAELGMRGVKVIILGDYGVYNELGRDRNKIDRVYDIDKEKNIKKVESADEIIRELDSVKNNFITINDGKDNLILEVREKDGRLLVHILNPDNERDELTVYVKLNKLTGKYSNAKLFNFENAKLDEFDKENGILKISGLKTMVTIELNK